MTNYAQNLQPRRDTFLGFPLDGFGLFTSLLLTLATGFFTFFASTTLAIFALLGWNLFGHHTVNFADSYLFVGFPAGLVALIVAFFVFARLWLKARSRKWHA
jgi:phosphatidylserine synthase